MFVFGRASIARFSGLKFSRLCAGVKPSLPFIVWGWVIGINLPPHVRGMYITLAGFAAISSAEDWQTASSVHRLRFNRPAL